MSVPAERVWVVDHFVVAANGEFVPDPSAVNTAMLEVGAILSRIGGVVSIASRRQEIAPGRVETVATVFRWRSFVPLDKSQEAPPSEQEEAPEPAAEPPAVEPPAEVPPAAEEPQAA